MEKGPAYENFDLDIKNQKELEEAKKIAGVKSKIQSANDAGDAAAETGDEVLFDNAVKANQDRTEKEDIITETREKELLRLSIKNLARDEFPEADEKTLERLEKRALNLYESEGGKKSPQWSVEQAREEEKTSRKEYKNPYSVDNEGIVKIEDDNAILKKMAK